MAKMYGLMRLGRDAEIRRTPGGDPVCNLSLAYNYGQKDDSGERPSQWVNASLWGKRAESLAEYLTKGSLHLFTLDNIHMRKYTDKDGYEAFSLDATVVDVELGPRKDGAAPASSGGSSTGTPQRRPASGGSSSAPAPAPKPAADIPDDDIPF